MISLTRKRSRVYIFFFSVWLPDCLPMHLSFSLLFLFVTGLWVYGFLHNCPGCVDKLPLSLTIATKSFHEKLSSLIAFEKLLIRWDKAQFSYFTLFTLSPSLLASLCSWMLLSFILLPSFPCILPLAHSHKNLTFLTHNLRSSNFLGARKIKKVALSST